MAALPESLKDVKYLPNLRVVKAEHPVNKFNGANVVVPFAINPMSSIDNKPVQFLNTSLPRTVAALNWARYKFVQSFNISAGSVVKWVAVKLFKAGVSVPNFQLKISVI